MTPFRSATVGVLLLVVFGGCGSQAEKQTHDIQKSHLTWLLKVRAHALSQGQPLRSQDDYKRYVENLEPATRDRVMQGADVSNVDELFVSERDSQPYVIFYGQPPAGVDSDVVGYEQKGVDGRRYVGFGLIGVAEVDEQRFNQLVPPAARPAQ